MNTTIMTTMTGEDFKTIVKDCLKEEMAMYFSGEKNKPQYDMLSMQDLCIQLKVSKPTIINWTKKKILIGHKLGRRVFYKKEEVDRCLKEYKGSVAQEFQLMAAFRNLKGEF